MAVSESGRDMAESADGSGRRTRYSNWRFLGKGGTAVVYRVLDNDLRCDVAIKLVKPEVLASGNNRKAMMETLRNEVMISRLLRHQYICPIHDLYEGPEGVGTVMDFIEGGELRDWMNKHQSEFLKTAAERLELLTKVTEALVVAHTTGPGIVHRDLKPQNILLRSGMIHYPIIMDFGFSVLGERATHSELSGFSPKYMAPEQLEAPDKVDRRADLFALGIMAYELFTGEVPPTSCKDILKTRKAPRIPLGLIEPPSRFNAAVKPGLDRTILQLMAYEPERRIQSAEELLAILRHPADLIWKDEVGRTLPRGPMKRAADAKDIPGGDFYLGSRPGKHTPDNEKPGLKVRMTPFRIDACPVTNQDFREFCKATGRQLPQLCQHEVFGRPDNPVVGVIFEEVQAYAEWVGGFVPSEAQWECAARGGVPFAEYPWGKDPPSRSRANINGADTGTTPIRSFPEGVNAYGLYDMCGNVWEWCQDVYDPDFYRSIPANSMNPVNNKAGSNLRRVLRGGSFQSLTFNGRCAFRFFAPANERRMDVGFRVAYWKNN